MSAAPESGDVGDDEDEELGHLTVRARSPKRKGQGTSKLGQEMLRTNSQGSVISTEEPGTIIAETAMPSATLCSADSKALMAPAEEIADCSLTPPQYFPLRPGKEAKIFDMDATPEPQQADADPDPTLQRRHPQPRK